MWNWHILSKQNESDCFGMMKGKEYRTTQHQRYNKIDFVQIVEKKKTGLLYFILFIIIFWRFTPTNTNLFHEFDESVSLFNTVLPFCWHFTFSLEFTFDFDVYTVILFGFGFLFLRTEAICGYSFSSFLVNAQKVNFIALKWLVFDHTLSTLFIVWSLCSNFKSERVVSEYVSVCVLLSNNIIKASIHTIDECGTKSKTTINNNLNWTDDHPNKQTNVRMNERTNDRSNE